MTLQTSVLAADPATFATPLLAILVPSGGSLPPSLGTLDAALGGTLARAYAAGDVRGRKDEAVLLYPAAGSATRVLLLGLGTEPAIGAYRRAAAAAAKRARALGVSAAALLVADEAMMIPAAEIGQALGEGLPFGAWHFAEMKRPPEEPTPALESVSILAPRETDAILAGHRVGAAIGAGQSFTRGIQVLPGNVCTPAYIAAQAEALAARHGFRCTVLDKAAIAREQMGALLAVAQGSAQEPRFIALEYDGAAGAPVVLIGKGVSFDTGGISLKPADKMEDMKFDMSGAAAVLGTFEMLGRLKPAVRVVGLIPSAENMPSGTAVKPGDVVTSASGRTIEIINTDAEGRLLLCDALTYAKRFQPAAVLDIATLTGAIVVALGHAATGLFTPDATLEAEVRAAADRAGERVWPMPVWDEYRDIMKSDIADLKNAGGRPAGSISAAWFLREFVDGFPWAHLDIAGTAYSDREDATRVKGPTGVGVRLFSEFLLARAT
jgi:leucyl aminopeptidase